jgi:hypothetical protein
MTESDVWACSVCRSLNGKRADRCYSCHTPREVAGVKPADLPVTGAAPPPRITTTYRSSEGRAVTVTVTTILFILFAILALWTMKQLGDLRADGQAAAADALVRQRWPLLVVAAALGPAALVAYAAWISRVIENLPSLGAGYSRVSPGQAFFEPLIPGYNLLAMPARMSEVIGKLDQGVFAQALLGLAIIGVVAPAAVFIWVWRATLIVGTRGDLLSLSGTMSLVIGAGLGVAFLVGLVVIWHIERLCRARAETRQPG